MQRTKRKKNVAQLAIYKMCQLLTDEWGYIEAHVARDRMTEKKYLAIWATNQKGNIWILELDPEQHYKYTVEELKSKWRKEKYNGGNMNEQKDFEEDLKETKRRKMNIELKDYKELVADIREKIKAEKITMESLGKLIDKKPMQLYNKLKGYFEFKYLELELLVDKIGLKKLPDYNDLVEYLLAKAEEKKINDTALAGIVGIIPLTLKSKKFGASEWKYTELKKLADYILNN